jgi:hypothetical protein
MDSVQHGIHVKNSINITNFFFMLGWWSIMNYVYNNQLDTLFKFSLLN